MRALHMCAWNVRVCILCAACMCAHTHIYFCIFLSVQPHIFYFIYVQENFVYNNYYRQKYIMFYNII